MFRNSQTCAAAFALATLGGVCWSQSREIAAITDEVTHRDRVALPLDATSRRTGGANAATRVEGTHWKLIELGGKTLVSELDAQEANLPLNADEKRLSGSTGCNRLVGHYELHGHSLQFTPAGLTKMACPEPLMGQEQGFIHALSATKSYRIVDKTLELRDEEHVLAKFKASSASRPSAKLSPAPPSDPIDKWMGKWVGPEGTYLLLSKKADKYVVQIHSLDGLNTYPGVSAGDHIEFTRNGRTESIRAGSGEATGMKWLLDKKNCLIIKTGEGFCRK